MKIKQASIKEVRRIVAPTSTIEVRKNADGSRSTAGEAIVYNSLSEDLGGFKEIIKPGTFTQSLKDNPDVLILYGHDDNQILGRVSSGTLTINDTATALRFTCKLPNTTTANDLVALLERDDIGGMSFAFSLAPDGDTWGEDGNGQLIRTVNAANLFEISVVPSWPAYKATSVSLRTLPEALRAKHVAGMLTDAESTAFISGVSDDDDLSSDGVDDTDNEIDGDDHNESEECRCICANCLAGEHERCNSEECEDNNCLACPMQNRAAHLDLILRRMR